MRFRRTRSPFCRRRGKGWRQIIWRDSRSSIRLPVFGRLSGRSNRQRHSLDSWRIRLSMARPKREVLAGISIGSHPPARTLDEGIVRNELSSPKGANNLQDEPKIALSTRKLCFVISWRDSAPGPRSLPDQKFSQDSAIVSYDIYLNREVASGHELFRSDANSRAHSLIPQAAN
jgi:hypothetical protein